MATFGFNRTALRATQPQIHSLFCALFLKIVNGDRYRAMLNKFLFTKIKEEDIGNIWFQQDATMCHTAEATLNVLRPVFEKSIIKKSTADVV